MVRQKKAQEEKKPQQLTNSYCGSSAAVHYNKRTPAMQPF